MPGVSEHWGCVGVGAASPVLPEAQHRTTRCGEGHTEPCGSERCWGPWPCQHLPTSTCCELGREQWPHLYLSPAGRQCQNPSHAGCTSAADGSVPSPVQIPSPPLVWCLCLGTLTANIPHTANGVSVSRPGKSGRL